MFRLENLSKSFGARRLFRHADWQTSPGQRIGLVGPNGVGKSTLFRILVGQEEPDTGAVHIPKHVDIGYLPQEITVDAQDPLLEFITEGARHLLEMEERLQALEAQLGDDETRTEAVTEEYATLQDSFRRAGGYALHGTAREIAAGMGFSHDDFEQPLSSFSGGWRMRALIARLLLRRPELLLLDEPTNHLDLDSIEWLEGFLRQYEGTIVVISHDRSFLNRIVNEVAELRRDGVRTYKGTYDEFLKKREEERQRLIAAKEQQDKEIAHIEEFIERFRYKASKAKQVQSRIKRLEKIERIDVFDIPENNVEFRFPEPERLPKIVMSCASIHKAYGDNVVYDDADFQIVRGDKVALVGPNGAGKSTMLKLLAGVIEPDRGSIEAGAGVDVAYFAQHSVEQLDLDNTLLEEMEAAATMETSGTERDVLGAFGFSGDTVTRKISVLSGGEKTRLALAKMMMAPAGCLLLDEPTNHLDMDSREMLEQTLRKFDGAVCIVSHDRYFLNQVVERVVHVEDGGMIEYLGDYDYYRFKRDEERAVRQTESLSHGHTLSASASDEAITSKRELRRAMADLRKEKSAETSDLRRTVGAIEERIADAEARYEALEAELADPAIYEDADRLPEVSKAYSDVQEELEGLMEQWEEQQMMLEEIEEGYRAREAILRGDERSQ